MTKVSSHQRAHTALGGNADSIHDHALKSLFGVINHFHSFEVRTSSTLATLSRTFACIFIIDSPPPPNTTSSLQLAAIIVNRELPPQHDPRGVQECVAAVAATYLML